MLWDPWNRAAKHSDNTDYLSQSTYSSSKQMIIVNNIFNIKIDKLPPEGRPENFGVSLSDSERISSIPAHCGPKYDQILTIFA